MYLASLDDLRKALEAALKDKGMSASAVSKAAVGNVSAIKNLMTRRGEQSRAHPIENLINVANFLGLEVYVGPPRRPSNHRLVDDKSFEEKFYEVRIHKEATLSAGSGSFSETEVTESLAFRQRWFHRQRLKPDQCEAIQIKGDSMFPTFADGDIVLLDVSTKNVVSGMIYGLVDEDGAAIVKRLELSDDCLLIKSDNHDFHTRVVKGHQMNRINVIGRVAWHGHTWEV